MKAKYCNGKCVQKARRKKNRAYTTKLIKRQKAVNIVETNQSTQMSSEE